MKTQDSGLQLFSRAAAIVLVLMAMPSPLVAKPLGYVLPDDKDKLVAGKGLDTVTANCASCHSSEYIRSQPHGPDFGKAFWQAEVTKMINVYKAPIAADDVKTIVDYLSESYP